MTAPPTPKLKATAIARMRFISVLSSRAVPHWTASSRSIKNRADPEGFEKGVGYPDCAVRKPWRALGAFFLFGVAAAVLAIPQKPVWPLTLREGLPAALPG